MAMAVRLKYDIGSIGLAEAVEEAQGVLGGDGFIELADEDAAVVRMDELGDDAADKLLRLPASESLAGGRDVDDAAVGGEDVEQVAELLDDALRPIAALGELGQSAARRVLALHAEAGRQWACANARHRVVVVDGGLDCEGVVGIGRGGLRVRRLRGDRSVVVRLAWGLVLRAQSRHVEVHGQHVDVHAVEQAVVVHHQRHRGYAGRATRHLECIMSAEKRATGVRELRARRLALGAVEELTSPVTPPFWYMVGAQVRGWGRLHALWQRRSSTRGRLLVNGVGMGNRAGRDERMRPAERAAPGTGAQVSGAPGAW